MSQRSGTQVKITENKEDDSISVANISRNEFVIAKRDLIKEAMD